MRPVPSALQAKLDGGATTLATCWIIRRRDGEALGFTDHDRRLAIDGVDCAPQAGLSPSEVSVQFGMNVDTTDVAGALSDDTLREADLAAGRFDAATIDTWLVDWSEPDLHVLLGRALLGEVTREGAAFKAELRSITDALAQESGRVMAAHCSADLGDARCKVALASSTFTGAGQVGALIATSAFTVTGLEAFSPGWFTAGRLVWTSGANLTLGSEVKLHEADGVVRISLWQAMPEPIAPGDAFTISAGCDKRFATCRDRFGNAANFRGFPHIPGNDFLMHYPVNGEPGNTGASLQT